jgi:nucleotide-binding universal stress UspA family protein
MKKILVGYDGSEPSAHALDQASRIAKAYGASLKILTAADDRLIREDGQETMAADEALAQWTAEQGAERAQAAGVAQVETCIALKTPEEALSEEANAGGYDLLVVGHRGLGALKELFMGSTAKAIIDKAHCSVLVVR